jgi:hypothetical protein
LLVCKLLLHVLLLGLGMINARGRKISVLVHVLLSLGLLGCDQFQEERSFTGKRYHYLVFFLPWEFCCLFAIL